jgi:hypothetical protein
MTAETVYSGPSNSTTTIKDSCEAYAADVEGDGDIDGDADLDAAGSAWGSGAIALRENADAVGTSWTKHSIGNAFGQASSVHADDVLGDGDIDVLGTGFHSDHIW